LAGTASLNLVHMLNPRYRLGQNCYCTDQLPGFCPSDRGLWSESLIPDRKIKAVKRQQST
jgi:hypothetical protein